MSSKTFQVNQISKSRLSETLRPQKLISILFFCCPFPFFTFALFRGLLYLKKDKKGPFSSLTYMEPYSKLSVGMNEYDRQIVDSYTLRDRQILSDRRQSENISDFLVLHCQSSENSLFLESFGVTHCLRLVKENTDPAHRVQWQFSKQSFRQNFGKFF